MEGVQVRTNHKRGQTLIEVIVALALLAMTVPAIFTSLSGVIRGVDKLADQRARLDLARSQLEYLLSQPYHEDGKYALISLPEGYSLELKVSPVERYRFLSGGSAGGVQKVVVKVSGRHGDTELEAIKISSEVSR